MWSAPVLADAHSFRARFAFTGGRLFVAHDVSGKGLVVRELTRAGGPLDWTKSVPVAVPLPAGYETIYAIYPEADAYQRSPAVGVNIALVGKMRENEVLGVFATPQ